MSSSSHALLFQLKSLGLQQADDLAARLGISPQAVRQQLDRLCRSGLVAFEDRATGRGRPKRFWSLTEHGEARFPDSHAGIATGLIDAVRAEFGEAALDRLIIRRERGMAESYAAVLADQSTLAQRVAALAAQRAAEGYMARTEEAGDGFLLIEDHCPICAAAMACQGFCRSELALFQTVLGPGCTVERTDHLLAGARRCVYSIKPVMQSRTGP
jgi:predicted ArsR family transcriptional regulator